MEVLGLQREQRELEEALKMEINYGDIKASKDGKKLFKYLKKRRRTVNAVVKILKEMV